MTVMLCGLTEIRMERSLLEMGTQLMILPTTSFHTMNAALYCCSSSSPQVQLLCLSPVGSFSKPSPSDLGKAQDVPSIAF